jgi:cobalamin synthase
VVVLLGTRDLVGLGEMTKKARGRVSTLGSAARWTLNVVLVIAVVAALTINVFALAVHPTSARLVQIGQVPLMVLLVVVVLRRRLSARTGGSTGAELDAQPNEPRER